MTISVTQTERAVIIGYYRSGATLDCIVELTGLLYWQIEKIISEYLLETEFD